MVYDLVKATVLISAVHVAVGGSTSQRRSVAAVKRHNGGFNNSCDGSYASGCQNVSPNQGDDSYAAAPTGHDYSGGVKACYAQASGTDSNASHTASDTHAVHAQVAQHVIYPPVAGTHAPDARASVAAASHVQASGSITALVQGWGSLNSGLNQLTATFASGASVNVAIQAASSFQKQLLLVTRQYASCGCSPTAETRTAFEQMVVQFFLSMQHCLQTGQHYYSNQWSASFSGIFQSYSVAFTSLKAIALSLQVDLTTTLQPVNLDAQLFASAGLNVSALLQVDLSTILHPQVAGTHASDAPASVATASHVQASGSITAFAQGWGSLISGLNQLTATFSSGASVNVAIQAASSFQKQLLLITRQYSSCGCSPTAETRTTFEQMVVQFFLSMQHCLQTGQYYYSSQWSASFSEIFQSYSAAFTSLKATALSLQVDLTATLQAAHLDAHPFAAAGLNVSALMQVNLSASGFTNV